MFTMTIEQEKEKFEIAYGKKISVRTWYRYRKLLTDYKIPINTENLVMLAKFKKYLQHSNDSECFVKYLTLCHSFNTYAKSYTGDEFLKLLSKWLDVDFHPSTISGWFKPLGGFKKNNIYSIEDLTPATLKAFLIARKVYKN